MRIRSRLILMLLVFSLLLSACGAAPAEAPSEAAAIQATEAPVQTEAPTEAVEQTPAFLEKLHYRPRLSKTVLPEEDEATGTLKFYLNDRTVYAGAPVSDLLELEFHTFTDLAETLEPWHTSGVIRAEFVQTVEKEEEDAQKEKETENAFVYFVVLNASDEPCMISEGVIYSVTATYQDAGIRFGTGHEDEPFVTGVTTLEELTEAYGEPTHTEKRRKNYEEIFYYQPFNSVSFMFKNGILEQVNAYYSANVYGELAADIDFELTGTPMENDAMIMMSQYLDVKPYMTVPVVEEEPEEDTEKEKSQTAATEPEEAEEEVEMQAELGKDTGILKEFDDSFQLNGSTITLGCQINELPSPFLEDLNDLSIPVGRNYYIRTGRHDPEEFFVLNKNGQYNSRSDTLTVKGVIVENKNYCNWGFDNSAFHSFNCMGVTEDSTIDDILALFGAPRELVASSGERTCFLWMHYETEAGDYIHIRVDPVLNQVIEVHQVKHFDVEYTY